MKKRQVLVATAVAATAAASGMFGLWPVRAESEHSAISKAADILGVNQTKLLDAFKKTKIEIVEDSISKGLINPQKGIELIHKIEDIQDFLLLPKYDL